MRNRLLETFSGSARSPFATRSSRRMRLRRPPAVAARAEALEPRQLLTAWQSADPISGSSMYAVHHISPAASGVIFFGADGTTSGLCYKPSDSSEPQIGDPGTILGAVKDSAGDAGVVIRWPDNTLTWTDGPTSHSYTGTVSDEISNFCGVDGVGFYFSTWNSTNGANLWFTGVGDTALGTPTPMAPPPLYGTAYWGRDTRISWITAVPGNSATPAFDVMFSGDRCYEGDPQANPPIPRGTDGRQLWGATGANAPIEVWDTSSDVPPWCGGTSDPPYYGQCPWWMVTQKVNTAVGGKLYFADYASNSLGELWVSDGTTTTCIYDEESFDWGGAEVPFKPIAGMQGYLDGTTPRVYFYLDDSTPSDLWRIDGTSITAIDLDEFDPRYCAGPKIPGQQVAHNPSVIVTDPADSDYGTAYFTAGVYNVNGNCPYVLYSIAPNDTTAYRLWEPPGVPSGPAQDWLTIAETPSHTYKLYFKGDNLNPNERNLKTFSYDPGSGVITAAPNPNYGTSWLVYDQYADYNPNTGLYQGRLYYFSFSGTRRTNPTEYLCWWQ